MVTLHEEIRERVYAGVLGKLIGVYLGRAVEGWSYQAIRERNVTEIGRSSQFSQKVHAFVPHVH